MPQTEQRFISADSHVFEPPDLWTERAPGKFKDRVPHVINRNGADIWLFDNGSTMPLAAFGSAGEWKDKSVKQRLSELRPALFDPKARLDEALQDNVAVEVLYPSYGMPTFGIEDPELQTAVMRAYNDWVIEYCAADRKRLLPHAMIPSLDVDAAVKEVERTAKLGFRGVLINAHPRKERDYSTGLYENLWAALAESGMPASLHLYAGDKDPMVDLLPTYSVDPALVQRSLAQIVFSGVLERHPKLRLVVVESDVGWVASLLTRMDHVFVRKGPRVGTVLKSGLLPSELFKKHVSCVLTEDRAGILTLEITGTDMYMWGSDYPHNDSTWPHSREAIDKVFSGLPEADRRKIVYGNAARLYQLDN